MLFPPFFLLSCMRMFSFYSPLRFMNFVIKRVEKKNERLWVKQWSERDSKNNGLSIVRCSFHIHQQWTAHLFLVFFRNKTSSNLMCSFAAKRNKTLMRTFYVPSTKSSTFIIIILCVFASRREGGKSITLTFHSNSFRMTPVNLFFNNAFCWGFFCLFRVLWTGKYRNLKLNFQDLKFSIF